MAPTASGPPYQQALRKVAEEALVQLPECATAAIAVVEDDAAVVLLGTSLLGQQLEESQWELRQGPGVDAIRQLQVFNVACLRSTTSWPEFSKLATGRGVRSSLAVPITWRGRALGALSLYSQELDAFAGEEQIALQSAAAASLALSATQESGTKLDAESVRSTKGRAHRERSGGSDDQQAVS